MKKYIVVLSCAICLLAGCKIYRPYSRPEIKTDVYRDTLANDSSSLAYLPWKELFTDTQLQALIAKGLEQNTDLRVARLRVTQAEAVLQNARLSYLPSVAFTPEGSINSREHSKATQSYSLALSADWEIDIFGKITNAKRGAKAALEGSMAYRQAVHTQLIATIANSYYMLLMLDEQLAIQQSTLENWQRTIKTSEALKRSGKSNETAVLQAKANTLILESLILSIQQSIHETENSLSVILGESPQKIIRNKWAEQSFSHSISIGVPLQLLGNRPDVRQAEYNLAQSFYATNAARSAFYPSITLSGSAGWTNNVGTIVNPGQWLFSAVGSLVQPLFNKGTNIANLKIAKARQEEATLLFQQSILNAGQEVNDALTQWQTAQKKIEIGTQQLATLKDAVRKTELLMKYSSISYLEVLTAQQSLLDAELTQAQNHFDEVQGVINLYHALGGGSEFF